MNYLKTIQRVVKCGLLLAVFGTCHAGDKWHDYESLYFQVGTYTHTRDNPDYAGNNLMVGLEAIKSNNKIFGLVLFDNSFGQFSQYAYVGKKWDFSGKLENFHARLTGGVIHGYKEPWNDKLPFTTKNGWSPGFIPSFGYQKDKFGFDVMLLGYQGIMFSTGVTF